MKLFSRVAVLAVLTAGAIACTVTSTSPGTSSGSSSGSGATSEQLTRCHSGCDKMKFFQCSSAAELSKCYSDCDSAAPKSIDVFIACAENSICDPACRTNITPPPPAGGSSTSGGGGGGGVPASSCQTACTKLITTCSLAPVSQMQACVDACTKNGYQYQIDCVANNACADIQARCGGSTGGGSSTSSTGGTSGTTSGGTSGGSTTSSGGTDVGLFRCQGDCDMLLSRQCIDATQQSACRAKCALGTSPARDTFMGCAEASSDCTAGTGCVTVFTK